MDKLLGIILLCVILIPFSCKNITEKACINDQYKALLHYASLADSISSDNVFRKHISMSNIVISATVRLHKKEIESIDLVLSNTHWKGSFTVSDLGYIMYITNAYYKNGNVFRRTETAYSFSGEIKSYREYLRNGIYDAEGKMVAKLEHDSLGNLIKEERILPSGNGTVVIYKYDKEGRILVKKGVNIIQGDTTEEWKFINTYVNGKEYREDYFVKSILESCTIYYYDEMMRLIKENTIFYPDRDTMTIYREYKDETKDLVKVIIDDVDSTIYISDSLKHKEEQLEFYRGNLIRKEITYSAPLHKKLVYENGVLIKCEFEIKEFSKIDSVLNVLKKRN